MIYFWNRSTHVRDTPVSDGLVGFLGERLPVPMAKAAFNAVFESKNDKKEESGNNLCYEKESKEIREGLDVSRRT